MQNSPANIMYALASTSTNKPTSINQPHTKINADREAYQPGAPSIADTVKKTNTQPIAGFVPKELSVTQCDPSS
jgi:hypothetical protein